MKITILYDNTVYLEGLTPDWGFSCLVETNNKNILFDTGTNGAILLNNMDKMQVDPSIIDEIFISHTHFDHVGGLSKILQKNDQVKIYVPKPPRGIYDNIEIIQLTEPGKIHENIFSTGILDNIEQSMIVKTEKGLVIIAGCSHPKMEQILNTASQFGKLYGIIGGLHGFSEFELFQNLDLICPTHCTQHIQEIKNIYPEQYIQGGVGRIIEI